MILVLRGGGGRVARVYLVVHQDSGMRKGLLAAKARLWKEGFIITRLELISANKAANDVDNVRSTLEGFYVVWSVYGWTETTVPWYWIAGQGNYKQFVPYRVAEIVAKAFVKWRCVKRTKIQLMWGTGAYFLKSV